VIHGHDVLSRAHSTDETRRNEALQDVVPFRDSSGGSDGVDFDRTSRDRDVGE
jgi:hypothetical protein